MNKQQKSSWQKLKEEKYLFISLAWIWRACLLAVIGIVFLSFWSDGDLTKTRNFILIVAALLALPLAIHRMNIADKQLKATEKQMKQTDEENKRLREDAQRQKREDNFENLQRDLSSGKKSQQLRAIDQLWKLARSYARDYNYHLRVMVCLSDFLGSTKHINPNADVAIMVLKILTNLDDRHKTTPEQEIAESAEKDYYTRLENISISNIDLRGADFRGFVLKNITFDDVNLAEAHFDNAFLQNMSFINNINIMGASWKNISTPPNPNFNFQNDDLRGAIMQYVTEKSEDEWLREQQEKAGFNPTI